MFSLTYDNLFQGQTISFLNEDGDTCAKERVMVTDTEARFDVQGQMSYVFDYEQVKTRANLS